MKMKACRNVGVLIERRNGREFKNVQGLTDRNRTVETHVLSAWFTVFTDFAR